MNRSFLLVLFLFALILSLTQLRAAEPAKPVASPVPAPQTTIIAPTTTERGPDWEPVFRMGPIMGLGTSTVLCSSCSTIGIEARLGLASGGTFEVAFNRFLSLEAEVMYQQKGALYRPTAATQYINYNTIEFPISFKGRFGNHKVKGMVFGGPQFGIAVTRTITNSSGVTSDLPSEKYDLGVHVGGGIEIRVSPRVYLFATGRINIGLKNLDVGILNQSASSFGILSLYGVKFGF